MLALFAFSAILAAAASLWILRAYRRGGDSASPAPALIACALAAVGAMGLYLFIGRPALADAPFTQRMEALKHRDRATYTVEEYLTMLSEDAKARPTDPRPHIEAGEFLFRAGADEAAARAFDAALRRDPNSTAAMMGLGRAMVQMDRGHVSPEALQLFQRVAQARSDDPSPWLYQAMAAMEAGHTADARRFWGEALRRMAPDDPRRAMAQRMSAG